MLLRSNLSVANVRTNCSPPSARGAGALLEKPLDIPTLLRTIKRLLAEPADTRLSRLASRETEFYYSAAKTRPRNPTSPS